jgi:hypothetical protein
MHGQANIRYDIYLLIKYIKSVLWRVAKRLSYIEDARCLKVKRSSRVYENPLWFHRSVLFARYKRQCYQRSFLSQSERIAVLQFD